jgi:putative addiction module antidote
MPVHFTLKLTQIGNSVGVILPKEALVRMKLRKGDTVFLTESPGGYQVAPYNPDVAEQIELGRDFMSEFRDTFHALAK